MYDPEPTDTEDSDYSLVEIAIEEWGAENVIVTELED